MRISSEKSDSGYQAYVRNVLMRDREARIFLNDVEQDDVITADDRLGFIRKLARDNNGYLVPNGDQAKVEDVYGSVRIEIGGRIP